MGEDGRLVTQRRLGTFTKKLSSAPGDRRRGDHAVRAVEGQKVGKVGSGRGGKHISALREKKPTHAPYARRERRSTSA